MKKMGKLTVSKLTMLMLIILLSNHAFCLAGKSKSGAEHVIPQYVDMANLLEY